MLLVFVGIALGAGISYLTYDRPEIDSRMAGPIPAEQLGQPEPDKTISVRILGDGIKRPGHYPADSDSTVLDVIQLAGGLKTGAITRGIEWNAEVYDGLKITIPTNQTLRQVRDGEKTLSEQNLIRFRDYNPDQSDTEFININQAPAAELQELHGIGPVLSNRIIQFRNEHGGFKEKSELKDVLGIGDVTYQELRANIEVR